MGGGENLWILKPMEPKRRFGFSHAGSVNPANWSYIMKKNIKTLTIDQNYWESDPHHKLVIVLGTLEQDLNVDLSSLYSINTFDDLCSFGWAVFEDEDQIEIIVMNQHVASIELDFI